jgi:integrase
VVGSRIGRKKQDGAVRAKRTDIDWQGRTLFIGYTKNGEPILVPLSDVALALFASLPAVDGNPYFFVGRKTGHHLIDLGAALKCALTRVGLKGIRIHDLRRTVGSWLAQSGVSLHLIGDILNHLDPETTAGYAFFQTEQRREALGGHAEKFCVSLRLKRACRGCPRVLGRRPCFR